MALGPVAQLGTALFVSPDETQSAAELAHNLSASKGSISGTTRLLERFGLIEAVGRPGERIRRFRIRPGAFTRQMEQKLAAVSTWCELAARGLALLKSEGANRSQRLQEVHDFYEFMEREFPRLLEKWRRERRTVMKALAVVVAAVESLKAAYDALSGYRVHAEFEPEEIQVCGDWAFARGYESFVLEPKAGGAKIEIRRRRALSILCREPDGRWKTARGMTNYAAPEPEAAPAR